MAGKRKAVRIDDTQRTMTLLSPSSSVGTMTVHVPDMLMRANRRQYTQARAYDVRLKIAGMEEAVAHYYEIYTLSNAWWVKRAIEMAKGVYLDATKKERALLGKNVATYNDFIIQCATGAAGNFSDLYQFAPASSGDDMTGTQVATDESLFEVNQVVSDLKDDAGDTMGFTITDEDVSGVGVFNIFNEYLLSRTITPDADTRAGPYADLFELDEDALASLQQDGDLTPWDADAFPSPFVLADTIAVDQDFPASGARYSNFITAPLGIVLLKKRSSSGGEDNFAGTERILLDCRKGAYKGVHAPAYKAMQGPHRGLA